MTFELTDSLTDNIISALENQETTFLVNAETGVLVEKAGSIKGDGEIFYDIPEWTSKDGFGIREDFVSTVRIPLVKESLQGILHSGRGVFKNFRNELKNYPEIEKRWHIYKNRIMHAYINNWYNELREVWGLEKLDYLPESDENLLHDDFSFLDYCSKRDKDEVLVQSSAAFEDSSDDEEDLPLDLKSAVYEMWHKQFEAADAAEQTGIICRSLSDDFAGCITASKISEKQEKVMILTSLFVPENYRGLGIGTELFNMYLSKLKASGKTWIILPKTIVPEIMEPLLLRIGSKKVKAGFAVKLQ